MTKLGIEALVPGGIRPTDHVHHGTNDDTCSRCRKSTEDEVPLMVWLPPGHVDLLIYCQACTGPDAFAALATTVPGETQP